MRLLQSLHKILSNLIDNRVSFVVHYLLIREDVKG